jgi:hypothetical protein
LLTTRSATCWWCRASWALKPYRHNLAIGRAARRRRQQQHLVATRSVGLLREDRRRAGGAGQARRGAEGLPQDRCEQYAMVAAHFHLLPNGRNARRILCYDWLHYSKGRRHIFGGGPDAGSRLFAVDQTRHGKRPLMDWTLRRQPKSRRSPDQKVAGYSIVQHGAFDPAADNRSISVDGRVRHGGAIHDRSAVERRIHNL